MGIKTEQENTWRSSVVWWLKPIEISRRIFIEKLSPHICSQVDSNRKINASSIRWAETVHQRRQPRLSMAPLAHPTAAIHCINALLCGRVVTKRSGGKTQALNVFQLALLEWHRVAWANANVRLLMSLGDRWWSGRLMNFVCLADNYRFLWWLLGCQHYGDIFCYPAASTATISE